MRRLALSAILASAFLVSAGCESLGGFAGATIGSYIECLATHPDWSTEVCITYSLTRGLPVPASEMTAAGWDSAGIAMATHLYPSPEDQKRGLMAAAFRSSNGCPASGCVANCSAPLLRIEEALGLHPPIAAVGPGSFGTHSAEPMRVFWYSVRTCSNFRSAYNRAVGGSRRNPVMKLATINGISAPWSLSTAVQSWEPEPMQGPTKDGEVALMPDLSVDRVWAFERYDICSDPFYAPGWCEKSKQAKEDAKSFSTVWVKAMAGNGWEPFGIDIRHHSQRPGSERGLVLSAMERAHYRRALEFTLDCTIRPGMCDWNLTRYGTNYALALKSYKDSQ